MDAPLIELFLASSKATGWEHKEVLANIQTSGVHLTLDELGELVEEFSDAQTTAVLDMTPTDARRMMIVGFLRGAYVQEMAGIAKGLGIRITDKDARKGVERMRRRMVWELDKPVNRERMATHGVYTFLRNAELRDKVLQGPQEDAHTVVQQTLDILLDTKSLGTNPIPDLARASTILTMAAFLSEDVLVAWLRWILETWTDGEDVVRSALWRGLNLWIHAHAEHKARDPKRTAQSDYEKVCEELAALKANYEADMREMLAVMERQKEQLLARVRGEPESSTARVLAGHRILVVGDDSHAVAYRALVEEQGATFDFLPGFENDSQIASKMTSADGVVFLTAYASHLKFYALKARVDMGRAVMVNRAGLAAFRTGLEELGRKLEVAMEV